MKLSFNSPPGERYIGFFIVPVYTYTKANPPNNYARKKLWNSKTVLYERDVRRIVSREAFRGLPVGWYLVKPNAKFLDGPELGNVRVRNVLCWVRVEGCLDGVTESTFFPFEDLQKFPA